MLNRITTANAQARIVLSDGTEILIKSCEIGVPKDVNYISTVDIEKTLSASSNNPIGVPCSANGNMILISDDRSLMPENTESVYAGKLNNEAVIYITLIDEEGEVSFGTYFVEDWYSDISSDRLTEVTIEFTGIISYLNKSPAPSMNIEKDITAKKYLVDIIAKWNEAVEDKYKLTIDESKLTFGPFETMPYSDIDATDYGKMLTILSQSTLTNIYISNENEVLTDYYFDDKGSESVCEINDCLNAYQYNVGEGLLVKYKGVKVNYQNIIVNDSTCISSLTGQTLIANSDTTIGNIDLGGRLFKLNYIQVDCSDPSVIIDVVAVEYSKKYITITLNNPSENDLTVSIKIYGQTINGSSLVITRGVDPLLEVTNSILSKSDCETFADKLFSIISNKGSQLKLTGFFNPRINLGDIVYVDLKAINRQGYYKVHGIKTSVSRTIKTTLTLYSLIDQTISDSE